MKYEAVSNFHMRRWFVGVKVALSFLMPAGFGRGKRGRDEGSARKRGGDLQVFSNCVRGAMAARDANPLKMGLSRGLSPNLLRQYCRSAPGLLPRI